MLVVIMLTVGISRLTASADTLSVGVKNDILIWGGAVDANFPNETVLLVGDWNGSEQRTLLRFDVSTLTEPTFKVNSVTLNLTVGSKWGSADDTVTTEVHAISSANGDWKNVLATWNRKDRTIATPIDWAGSAGLRTATTDYDTTVLAILDITIASWGADPNYGDGDRVSLTFAGTSTELTALISGWVAEGEYNSGLVLFDPTPTYSYPSIRTKYYSSDSATTAYRPELVVDYIVPQGTLIILR